MSETVLIPVLPLRELCLFPEASLGTVAARPVALRSLEMAARAGGRLLALAHKDVAVANPEPKDLHVTGTVAVVSEDVDLGNGTRRVELDGERRARVVTLVAGDALVAEVQFLEEGDPGDDWGSAVEALARYLHAHAELRSFLDQQRRSAGPMAWV